MHKGQLTKKPAYSYLTICQMVIIIISISFSLVPLFFRLNPCPTHTPLVSSCLPLDCACHCRWLSRPHEAKDVKGTPQLFFRLLFSLSLSISFFSPLNISLPLPWSPLAKRKQKEDDRDKQFHKTSLPKNKAHCSLVFCFCFCFFLHPFPPVINPSFLILLLQRSNWFPGSVTINHILPFPTSTVYIPYQLIKYPEAGLDLDGLGRGAFSKLPLIHFLLQPVRFEQLLSSRLFSLLPTRAQKSDCLQQKTHTERGEGTVDQKSKWIGIIFPPPARARTPIGFF